MLVDEKDKGKEEEVGVGNQKKHSSNSMEGGGGGCSLMDPNETLIHGDEAEDKAGEAYKGLENSNHNSPS